MGLFSAAASLANTDQTNSMNYQIAKMTNEQNKELAEKQNEWNLARRNEEWQYNDPANQAQRLRNAGLSSAAAAQAVANVPAGQLQSADLANQQIGNPQIPADFSGLSGLSIIGMARQLEALKKERVEANVAERTENQQVQGILTDTDAKKWAVEQAIQDFTFKAEANPYSLRSLKYHADADKLLPQLQKMALKMQKQNLASAKQQYGFLEKFNKEQLNKIGEEIKETIARAQRERSETAENVANIQNINEDTVNKKKLGKRVDLENFGIVVDNVLKKYGTPASAAEKISALIKDGILSPEDVEDYLSGARDYVVTGAKKFYMPKIDLRSVFIHQINPGIGENEKMSLHQTGPWLNAMDGVYKLLHK